MSPGDVYGLLTVIAVLSAWASCDHVVQKIGLLMLVEWAATNVAYQTVGPHTAMLLIPSINGALAAICAIVGFSAKSKLALVVFVLYGLVGMAHVTAFVTRKDGTYPHYVALNVLFAMQLLVVGGSGAWMAIRRWAHWRGERLRSVSTHRAGVA